MTIILPGDYHARCALERVRVSCITPDAAARQDIRPLRIGILNVMPKAESYEFSLLHPLGRSILQVEPEWIRLETHSYSTSNRSHIRNLYVTFEEALARRPLDGLLLTGAPIEEIPYEHVHYWHELVEILRFARRSIPSTLGICWGGMALAKLLDIEKVPLASKLFGVYQNEYLSPEHNIVGDTDDVFWCPQSRCSGVDSKALEQARDDGLVRLLSYASTTGYTIFESFDQRYLMHLGHPEYSPERLLFEFHRDTSEGRHGAKAPENLDLARPVNVWRSHRNEFFSQWLRFIYESVSRRDRVIVAADGEASDVESALPNSGATAVNEEINIAASQ
jgi:homoserine O-succinyltransferase